MRTQLGFEPSFSTSATFDDFVRTRRLNARFTPETVASIERGVASVLTGLPRLPGLSAVAGLIGDGRG